MYDMPKSNLFSWRTAPQTRDALEHEARRHGVSVAAILDKAVAEWLSRRSAGPDEQEQARLHAAAAMAIGSIKGANPRRAENARLLVRRKLERRRAD
jgi:hypothetical protein